MKNYKALFERNRELILYIIFGLGTTVVNWGTYTLYLITINDSVFWANIFSWVCATVFAFITNKIWVFESRGGGLKTLGKEVFLFVSTRIGTGAIEMAAVPLLVKIGLNQGIWGVEGLYVKVGVSIFIVLLNYIISKKMIFKK